MNNRDFYKDVLFGLAVGDALGVPVEFTQRRTLRLDPVTHMRGFGSHNQPAGTWSNDSSLAFCLAETLAGLLYGYENIPEVWRFQLARYEAIEDLAERLSKRLSNGNE